MKKDVSIITPCFNAAETIERCVASVVNQSGSFSIEHILVDDGSTDATSEILRSLSSMYAHIKVLHQCNRGAGVARNQGIGIASGKYIAFLDSDDYWSPEKLESQIEFMESNKLSFSYGSYYISDPDGNRTLYSPPATLKLEDILIKCPIGCLTACYNQWELGKVYMPEIRRGQDWGLWLRILKSGVVASRYPGALAVYTVNESSLSSNKLKKAVNVFDIYREVLGFGAARSSYYTFRHALAVLRARKRG